MLTGRLGSLGSAKPLLLLDTNILTARARKNKVPGLQEWLSDTSDVVDFCICFPVLVEMKRGLMLSSDKVQSQRIRDMIDGVLESNFVLLSTDFDVADTYARLLSIPELKRFWYVPPAAKHRKVGNDLLIAAISISYQIPVATLDCDYSEINEVVELPGIYDPLKNAWTVDPIEPIDLPKLQSKLPPAF
jgi:predicted nucleic acid-binding protein